MGGDALACRLPCWYAFFLANGSVVPTPPGWWDVFFAGAQLLLIAAVAAHALVRSHADRGAGRLRDRSAGIALGAAFVGRGLENHVCGVTTGHHTQPTDPRNRHPHADRRSRTRFVGRASALAALLGLGEIGLIVGSLIYSYAAVQGHFDNDRWANLGWTAGAELSMLAAATIILGIDRPLRLPRVTGYLGIQSVHAPPCS